MKYWATAYGYPYLRASVFMEKLELSESGVMLTVSEEKARVDLDLRSAQILMIGSEACADPKIDASDTRDPRYTPTLAAVAKLRAERDALAKRVDIATEALRHESENECLDCSHADRAKTTLARMDAIK